MFLVNLSEKHARKTPGQTGSLVFHKEADKPIQYWFSLQVLSLSK